MGPFLSFFYYRLSFALFLSVSVFGFLVSPSGNVTSSYLVLEAGALDGPGVPSVDVTIASTLALPYGPWRPTGRMNYQHPGWELKTELLGALPTRRLGPDGLLALARMFVGARPVSAGRTASKLAAGPALRGSKRRGVLFCTGRVGGDQRSSTPALQPRQLGRSTKLLERVCARCCPRGWGARPCSTSARLQQKFPQHCFFHRSCHSSCGSDWLRGRHGRDDPAISLDAPDSLC